MIRCVNNARNEKQNPQKRHCEKLISGRVFDRCTKTKEILLLHLNAEDVKEASERKGRWLH